MSYEKKHIEEETKQQAQPNQEWWGDKNIGDAKTNDEHDHTRGDSSKHNAKKISTCHIAVVHGPQSEGKIEHGQQVLTKE